MVEKLRILAITNEAGDTPAIKHQLDALRTHNVDIDLLDIARKNKLNYVMAAWTVLRSTLRKRRYDLIHAFYGHCGMVARMQFRSPVVVTFQGSDLLGGLYGNTHHKDGMIGRLAALLSDGVIVMSEQMKEASRRRDAFVIPFGIDTELFAPYSMEQARHELGLPLNTKLILFPWDPSRIEKQFHIAETALHILQANDPQIELVPIFGKSHQTVARYMNACDVMVLVSEHEGSPVAVREAMACNLSVVSVDVGDVKDIISEVDGCYICKHDPEDVADKLGNALSLRRRTQGRQKILQLDAAWAADQVYAVYQHVLNRQAKVNSNDFKTTTS